MCHSVSYSRSRYPIQSYNSLEKEIKFINSFIREEPIDAVRMLTNKLDILCLDNSFLASGNFCCLLITFANSLDPDQDQQRVCPDLVPNRLTL